MLCLAVSCGRENQHLNLVIIGLDTVRRDHLGCYGYERNTSPNLDALAARSTLFEEVVSQSPWTLPSFVTVFTSLYPSQHTAGLRILRGGSDSETRFQMSRMSPTVHPLASMLHENGYSTGAIINAPCLAPESGTSQGFEYYSTAREFDGRPASVTTRDALTWIDQNKDKPFFIFVHYFDPHLTFSPPAPYDTLFDPGYRGIIGNSFDLNMFPRARETGFEVMKVLSKADWNHIEALYDGEIAFADHAIGDLLKGLEERGLKDNTLIVAVGDHGEEFYEHGGFEHGHTLFDELIRVPLIFSLPGRLPENLRVAAQIRLVDVLPTILDILGIESSTRLEGVSLMPLMTGLQEPRTVTSGLLSQEFAFSEAMLYGTEKACLVTGPWKLVYDIDTEENLLFNLARDPGEQDNLTSENPEIKALLEGLVVRTLLDLSQTWYIEIAGGKDPHTFDLGINIAGGAIFRLNKYLDTDGDIVDDDWMPADKPVPNALRVNGLKIRDRITLAFKTVPTVTPVGFDFRMNGTSAENVTYLGQGLRVPASMPFMLRPDQASESKGSPHKRPEPPYILVWHSGSGFEPGTPAQLGEDTERKLRALGYIQ
jgi:arylsulfatase A-like enzyme